VPTETPVKPDSSDQRPPFARPIAQDLSEDLEGAPRNLALAIHQMGEMGVLLLEKLLDGEAKVQR
jgi:hypothetical protein